MPSWLIENSQDMTVRFNEQLSRMKTDRVDFYLLHALNAQRWHKLRDAGVIEWSLERIREGSIGCLGFSFHDTNAAFHEIVDAYQDWTFCQIQYNFLDEQTQAGTEGLRYAASKGMGIVVMEPLRGGKLAAPNDDIMNLWHDTDPSRTPAEWALDWVWNHTEVSLLLSGMSTLEQVRQNLEAADRAQPDMLSSDDLATIARVRDAYAALTRVPCTGCRYCMPCPHGVDIPGVFELANEGSMFGRWDVQRKRYERMRNEKTSTDQCVRCGLCETKCPQHIAIRNELAALDKELA
jgi:predicted aldo/keto reductase-like oxidoreductase